MKLFCVRHGEANSADVDPQRGLSEKGQLDVTKVAHFLQKRDFHISHILHSTRLRAKQTAEILGIHLNASQIDECENILEAEADVQPLLDMIKTWHDDTMIVGHLPFMAKLVSALVIDDENYFPIVNFPPGAIVCLDHYEDSRWIVNWILRPSIIPALEDE